MDQRDHYKGHVKTAHQETSLKENTGTAGHIKEARWPDLGHR